MPHLKQLISAIVVALLPVALASPASAIEYDRLNISVDCADGEPGEDDHVIRDGDILKVTFKNCDGFYIQDSDDTGNATMPDNTVIDDSNMQEVSGNNFVVTVVGEADLEVDNDEDVDVFVAGSTSDPSSTLLATKKMTIGLSAHETMFREEMVGDPVGDDGFGRIYLNSDPNCLIEPGLHVYNTLEIEITKSGVYDFRAISVNPIDEDLNWGVDKFPTSDPLFVLYENFNPALPENNIVGCNDDGDESGSLVVDGAWDMDGGDTYEGVTTESGMILDDQWPWFQSNLEPGKYTLVYTPFLTAGTDDFALGQWGPTSRDNPITHPELIWEPSAQSVTYEMWGPAGGIVFNEPLAPTGGVEPSFALWAGLGIAGIGIAVGVARRRSQRA